MKKYIKGPTRQHTVPRLYLKNFDIDGIKHLYVLDKKWCKLYKSGIKNISVINNFYTCNIGENNNYEWENFYAREVEPDFEKALSELISKTSSVLVMEGASVLQEEVKRILAKGMVHQLYRGKIARQYENRRSNELLPKVIKKGRDQFKNNKKVVTYLKNFQANENFFKEIYAQIATSGHENLDMFFLDRTWIVYKSNGDDIFITSDNPVMFMNNVTLNATPFQNSLLNPTTVIYFPISSYLMLALYHQDYMFKKMKKFANKMIFANSRMVSTFNKKQLEQCDSQVYAGREETLKYYLSREF